jgi:hypothetical protein
MIGALPQLVEKVLAQFVPAPDELLQLGRARAYNDGLHWLVRLVERAVSTSRAPGPPAFIGPRPRECPHIHVADTTVMMCWSELFNAAFTRLRSDVRVL